MAESSSPSPLTELQDSQRRLAAVLDQIDTIPSGSGQHEALFSQVNTLVHEVATQAAEAPRRAYQIEHDWYAPRTRVLGIVFTAITVAAAGAAVTHWISLWLLLMLIPLFLCAITAWSNPAGSRDVVEPVERMNYRFGSTIIGVVAATVVALAGLVSGWFLVLAIPATLACVALLASSVFDGGQTK